MGSIQTLWRGRLQHKYHFCSRCGVRYPLSKMTYQNNLLVCIDNCLDKSIPQERDSEIYRMKTLSEQGTENQPDKMLTDSSQVLDDDVQFMP